ncbi:hypothetical protein POUND7_014502 [Theobroma cacao]
MQMAALDPDAAPPLESPPALDYQISNTKYEYEHVSNFHHKQNKLIQMFIPFDEKSSEEALI